MEEALHSRVGASSYYRWGRGGCPGSVRLSEGVKSQDSSYAREGSFGHAIAAYYLTHRQWPSISELDKMALEAKVTDYDYLELRDHIEKYTSTVINDFEFYSELGETEAKMLVEHRFNLSCVYPGAYGTADSVLVFPNFKKIIVNDLKLGAGIPVDVEDSEGKNKQLKYYGLGALLSLSNSDIEEVELVISQPRCYHPDGPIRRTTISALELLEFSAELEADCKATADPNAPLNPGDHCKFCPANGFCPALKSAADIAARSEFLPIVQEAKLKNAFHKIDPSQLSKALQQIPTLEAFIDGVRSLAYQEAVAGRVPEGFKLVKKRSHRKWLEHVGPGLLMHDFGLDDSHVLEEPKLKSPAQVEKILSKQAKPLLEKYIAQESTGLTLVPVEDKRDAIPTGPKSCFDAIPVDFVEANGEELKLMETVYV